MEVSRIEALAAGYLTAMRLVGHYELTMRAEVATMVNVELTSTPLCFPNDDDAESIAVTGVERAVRILEEVLSPESAPAITGLFDLLSHRNVAPGAGVAATQAMLDALTGHGAKARGALLRLNQGYQALAA
jgi:hypothetical protein